MMVCKYCKLRPVIKLVNSNVKLCKSCFIRYFEKKVLKTIRNFKLLDKEDKILVAESGGKDSLSVLYFLNKLAETRKKLEIEAILIDEGIKGYREKTIKDAKRFCKENKIKLHIYSFKKEFRYSLDELKKKFPDVNACSMCGVLRRYLLNKKSRLLKVKKLATGHNLDDEAQAIMMNQFRNNIALSARLGPFTGVKKDKRFVPRIKPFYLLSEREVMSYAFLKKLIGSYIECPYEKESYRCDVRDFLNSFEEKYPGTKHSIIASFLEILPILKKSYKDLKINSCKKCREPSSSEICSACKILEKIK